MPTTTTAFRCPPDLFGRGWCSLSGAAKLAQEPVWWLERHGDLPGVWLVTQGGPVLLAAWVPDDPGAIDLLPAFDAEPDLVVAIGDPDKRLDSLCRHLARHWGANTAAPGLDEYLQVRPGEGLGGQMSLTNAGSVFESSKVSFWSEGERHDVPAVNEDAPQWRSTLRTFSSSERQHIQLDADVLNALRTVKGYKPAQVTFGAGGLARLTFDPVLGDVPRIVGYALVGTREDSKPAPAAEDAPARFIQQAYDDSRGWVDDIDDGTIEE